MPRRLIIEMIGGRVRVRDRSRPRSSLVEVTLPDGRRVEVAGHLCGWHAEGGDGALWPDVGAARRALTELAQEGPLEDLAGLGGPEAAPLPSREFSRLQALILDNPGAWMEGPHRDEDDAGWHLIISGTSALEWIVGRGDDPGAAARDALDQALRRTRRPGAP